MVVLKPVAAYETTFLYTADRNVPKQSILAP